MFKQLYVAEFKEGRGSLIHLNTQPIVQGHAYSEVSHSFVYKKKLPYILRPGFDYITCRLPAYMHSTLFLASRTHRTLRNSSLVYNIS